MVAKVRSIALREQVAQWKRDNPGSTWADPTEFFVQAGNEQVCIHCFGKERTRDLKGFLRSKGWVIL